jgi:poly-gamma-glutamate synthesis protein (capsule biosynthesis protein)
VAVAATVRPSSPIATVKSSPPKAPVSPTEAPEPTLTATATATSRPNRSASAVAANEIVIAVGAREVAGLGGRDLADRLRDALAESLPDQQIEVVDEDRLDEAAIVITVDNPAPDFTAQVVANIPEVLVTSPRLPLNAISGAQAVGLLNGAVTDWREIGAAPTLKVEVLGLRGTNGRGVDPVQTYRTYAALVAGFEDHPGGVAAVPLDQVDYRVNVLAIDGIDPLRGEGPVLNYPLGDRLFVGVRPELQELLQPAVDTALNALGLPRAAAPVVSVGIAGDILPVGLQVNQMHLFDQIAPVLSSFDQTIANFAGGASASSATPVADASPVAFSPEAIAGLATAGIDAVSLANDRSFANGEHAFTAVRTALTNAGLASFGAGSNLTDARAPYLTEIDGVSVAVIGVNGITGNRDSALPGVTGNADAATGDRAGTNPFVESRMRSDIAAAAEQAEVVIVYLYAGVAGRATPPSWTISAAHEAINAGADLVVVSHPGLPGGIEIYEGQPIVYSLGNLVSDSLGLGAVETRQGVILEVTLRGDTIVGLRAHGVVTGDDGRPRPMTDSETATMLNRVWWLSDQLSANG